LIFAGALATVAIGGPREIMSVIAFEEGYYQKALIE
jgi:hypothetical protein